MSGIEVLQTVRSWSNVPVIVLSIEAEEDHKVHFLRSGADDYVIKPFGIAELAARCDDIIRPLTRTRWCGVGLSRLISCRGR